jgi:hypothetical protein
MFSLGSDLVGFVSHPKHRSFFAASGRRLRDYVAGRPPSAGLVRDADANAKPTQIVHATDISAGTEKTKAQIRAGS